MGDTEWRRLIFSILALCVAMELVTHNNLCFLDDRSRWSGSAVGGSVCVCVCMCVWVCEREKEQEREHERAREDSLLPGRDVERNW